MMPKKSQRFFLPGDDISTEMLPTDHEPTLKIMGIKFDWDRYDQEAQDLGQKVWGKGETQ